MADGVDILDAASATIKAATDDLGAAGQSPKVSLLRGNSTDVLYDLVAALGDGTDTKNVDPDGATASINSNLMGILQQLVDILTSVQIIDNNSYVDDAAAPANPTGSVIVGERDDALTTVTPVEGDMVHIRATEEGALWVKDFYSYSITVAAQAIQASVQIMDDWDESDRAKANIIVGQAGVAAGAGAVGATVQRATLASDDPAVVALQVIDDWDETNRAAVNLISGQAGIAAGAGAVGVTVPRVTHASDDPVVTALQIMDDWDESDRAKVNVIAGQAGIAGGTGVDGATVPRVSLATDVALPAGTNEIGKLAAGTAAIGKLAANDGVDIGDVDVATIAAGANIIGDVGISGARTSGGTSFFYDNDLDETKIEVKATAGQIYWMHAINKRTTPLYLQVFNKAAASVTVGTTVPDMEFIIPSQGDANGAGFTLAIPNGIAMGTGITVACTTGSRTAGAPGANECQINMGYA